MNVIPVIRGWLTTLSEWWSRDPLIGTGILFLIVAVSTVPREYGIGVGGCGLLALGFADRIKRSSGNRPLRLTILVLGWILMLLGFYLVFTQWHPQHLWPFD
jgi:hypothetical protein